MKKSFQEKISREHYTPNLLEVGFHTPRRVDSSGVCSTCGDREHLSGHLTDDK